MEYGIELLLDLIECDVTKFKRKHLKAYFIQLCDLIDMQAEALYFWDDFRVPIAERQTDPRTKGTTAIQFILTSNITVHTLDLLGIAFVNIFSCKTFNIEVAQNFTAEFFRAKVQKSTVVKRGIL